MGIYTRGGTREWARNTKGRLLKDVHLGGGDGRRARPGSMEGESAGVVGGRVSNSRTCQTVTLGEVKQVVSVL